MSPERIRRATKMLREGADDLRGVHSTEARTRRDELLALADELEALSAAHPPGTHEDAAHIAAQHVGIPGAKMTAWLRTMEMCGFTLALIEDKTVDNPRP